MPPAAKKLTVAVNGRCAGAARKIVRLLPALRVQAEVTEVPPEQWKGWLSERPADAVVLCGEDFDLAAELADGSYTGVLLLAPKEELERLTPACIVNGILTAPPEELERAFPQLLALCTRLRSLRVKNNTLRRQLDDTRLVSRAKLLLMSRFKMSESEAHRYIEKTAMDSGGKRRDVAESIIRTYED